MSQRGGGDYRGQSRGGAPSGHGGYQGSPSRGGGGGYQSRGGDRGRGDYPNCDSDGGGGRGGPDQSGIYRPGPVNVDSRLQDASQDQLVAAMGLLAIAPQDLPSKPGFGTAGRKITVRSNFFAVRVGKGVVLEYAVEISPATAIRRVKRRIFQLAEGTQQWTSYGLKGNVAHDHSAKLISAKPLPQPLSIRVLLYDEDEPGPTTKSKEYTLSITYVQEIDLEGLKSHVSGDLRFRNLDISSRLAALQIILAAHANRSSGGGVVIGRNRFFFKSAVTPFDLGGGLEAWRGFYSSVRPAHNQLMVNVNVCTTAFYKEGNLAAAMMTFRKASFGARMGAFVKGLRVKTHLGHKKTIKTTANVSAKQHKFYCDELRSEISVEDYFRKRYGIKLMNPEMELVDVGSQRPTLIPAETCMILPNQPFRGKLTDEHTAQMILAAAKSPNVNAASIETKGLDSLGFRPGASAQLQAFGIAIKNEMTVVPARILKAPGVQYGSSITSVDGRASWNLQNVKFKRGAAINNVAVVLIKDNNRDEFSSAKDPELIETVRRFIKMCTASGMAAQKVDPPVVEVDLPPKGQGDPIRSQVILALDRCVREGLKRPPGIFLVILSNGDKHVYAQVKALFDMRLGIPSVCVQSGKIRKQKPSYFANVALKFNMKLGGVNHVLEDSRMKVIRSEPTMMVGIDVTHPGPGSVKGTPSIAAVVASVDNDLAQFPASLRIQRSTAEMVTDLAEMMVERLELFMSRNKGIRPTRIIVYRDGVSEGQFGIVIADELVKIKKAFRKFDNAKGPYTPKLTIVICGKRHHTRFYPTRDEDADNTKNPLPGTVVDRGVTSIYHFDFFLQAHGGLQGSTKPTHYYVVHDDIRFTQDALQGLTNDVSYLFARATKAVSLVSPAYYADLACERGRCYLHPLLQGISSSGGSVTSGGEEQFEAVMKEAQKLWGRGVSEKLKDTMFYL